MKKTPFRVRCIIRRYRRNCLEWLYQMYGLTRRERIAETGKNLPVYWEEEEQHEMKKLVMPKKEVSKKDIRYWKAKRQDKR